MEMCYNHMFIYAEFEIIIMFFKERRLKYKPVYTLDTHNVLHFLYLYRDFVPPFFQFGHGNLF